MLFALMLLPLALALPNAQTTFSSPSSLPPLNRAAFVNHTLIPLNDGTFLPSPAFGVGSAFYQQNATEAVRSALRVGYRHLDNAAIYGNEESVGEAIRLEGIPREELYITTKYDYLDEEDVEVEFQKSLKKLGVTYIDLYLIHFPKFVPDPLKVWRAFESLVAQGLVRSIGVSNYDVATLSVIIALAEIKPSVNQIRYHPYNQLENAPVVKLSDKYGIITAAYSSLTPITKMPGGPFDEVMEKVAEKSEMTIGQVILSWVKSKGICVVTTSGKDYRQKEQLDVFGPLFPALPKKEVKQLDAAGVKGELKEKLPGL
ncbi:hypothetical protein P7C70_g4717, partial [Phenoliferia sp. Uapishka_3]